MTGSAPSHRRINRSAAAWLALCLAPVLPAGGASAAPQILGLIATDAPLPLACAGGLCEAELSAFCLQPERVMPEEGTAYRAAADGALTLSVTGAGGAVRAVTAGGWARLVAVRGHHAVRVTVAEDRVRALGGGRARIAVGPRAAAVPLAVAGDAAPLDAREIAYVTGPQRAAAAEALAAEPGMVGAARTLGRLINALPRGRRVGAAQRASLWRRVIGAAPGAAAGPGLARAAASFETCRGWADTGRGEGLRECLEEMHDHSADDITGKARDVTRPGS